MPSLQEIEPTELRWSKLPTTLPVVAVASGLLRLFENLFYLVSLVRCQAEGEQLLMIGHVAGITGTCAAQDTINAEDKSRAFAR